MQTFLPGKGQYMCEQFIPVKLDKGTWLCFPWSFRKPASLCIPFSCLKSWKELSKAHSVLSVDWINSKHEYNCFSGLLRLIKIIATFTWLRMFYYWLQIVFRSLTSLASWSSTDQGNQRREFLNIWGIRNCFNNQIKKNLWFLSLQNGTYSKARWERHSEQSVKSGRSQGEAKAASLGTLGVQLNPLEKRENNERWCRKKRD